MFSTSDPHVALACLLAWLVGCDWQERMVYPAGSGGVRQQSLGFTWQAGEAHTQTQTHTYTYTHARACAHLSGLRWMQHTHGMLSSCLLTRTTLPACPPACLPACLPCVLLLLCPSPLLYLRMYRYDVFSNTHLDAFFQVHNRAAAKQHESLSQHFLFIQEIVKRTVH
jgi:hypothetical protein